MMHRKEIERSVAGLDEHLRDALLLSTECTYAESAKRLGITMDQLVENVDEAKRKIVAELLGDWQDPESEFVVDMHIYAVAMSMQRRRRSVLHRVRRWLERLVGQTSAQPWRSALVPAGSLAAIAIALATSPAQGSEQGGACEPSAEAEGLHTVVRLEREQVEDEQVTFVGCFDGRAGEAVSVTARSEAFDLVGFELWYAGAQKSLLEAKLDKTEDPTRSAQLMAGLSTAKYTVRVKVDGHDVDLDKVKVTVKVTVEVRFGVL